ncbi:MAG TPA: Lrp/AsnC family transcriptional regulator [Candidatus Obscuribacter sp.]|nr:Lrp/AsnC family transcriptional regulator [Candidatus Obscuribacter sp.]MBK9276862.1 Lrp/AsnC family transcriptional regulator [Candidatus Obscuribacter sp.]MBL8081855.1 Lrp/AsnC family transcriptional regulator [Candidatus Obscuribacter sp.]HNG73452.1 Lrp/AsnC family transcriptional regulator [Candidatus Obscuribacter sp.]HNM51302.1 Lrp/AsnC family transcriptional regulator [Candidatus Obscuribacter sp.]
MDDIDLKLLALLQEDAKQKYADLAQRLNLSAPSVHARVKKMEQAGIIESYGLKIDSSKIGLKLCAFVRVTTEGVGSELGKSLYRFKEVEEVHSVAGEECLLLKVRTADTDSLSHFLDEIRRVKGVRKTITSIVLTTVLSRQVLPENSNV